MTAMLNDISSYLDIFLLDFILANISVTVDKPKDAPTTQQCSVAVSLPNKQYCQPFLKALSLDKTALHCLCRFYIYAIKHLTHQLYLLILLTVFNTTFLYLLKIPYK